MNETIVRFVLEEINERSWLFTACVKGISFSYAALSKLALFASDVRCLFCEWWEAKPCRWDQHGDLKGPLRFGEGAWVISPTRRGVVLKSDLTNSYTRSPIPAQPDMMIIYYRGQGVNPQFFSEKNSSISWLPGNPVFLHAVWTFFLCSLIFNDLSPPTDSHFPIHRPCFPHS